MTKTWISAFLLAPALLVSPCAWSQPAIASPYLGFVKDGAGALRPAYGLAGNFILGPPVIFGSSIEGNIISEAFSGSIGLLKTDSSLAAFDSQGKILASTEAAPGPALFAFSLNGVSSPQEARALAYLASTHTLVEWNGSAFAPVALNYELGRDAVLGIALPGPSEASLIVRRNARHRIGELWEIHLSLGGGGIVSQNAIIGVHAPVLALPPGDFVYSDTNGIVVRRTDGSEVHIAAPLPARFALEQMNQEWVQLADLNSNARFAIRTTASREGFYQLPSSNPE